MAPVPGVHRDAPEKSAGDADTVDDEDIPTFIIPADNSSDSDDEEEDVYGGYQLLPQDPDNQGNSGGLSGSAVTPGGDVGTPELDDVIMSVLDAGDCPYTTAASYGEVERGSSGPAARGTGTSGHCGHDESSQRKTIVEPMDHDQAEKVKAAMKGFVLPTSSVPHWASVIPEDEWKARLLADVPSRTGHKPDSCCQADTVDKT